MKNLRQEREEARRRLATRLILAAVVITTAVLLWLASGCAQKPVGDYLVCERIDEDKIQCHSEDKPKEKP